MKREIKFKAQRADGKGWIEGYGACSVPNENLATIIGFHGNNLMHSTEVIPETICQFIETKNGIDFWESDKVYHEILGVGEIKWASTGYVIKYSDQSIDLHEDWRELRFIGNIHD
jgi:hypothetical protein